MSPRDEISGWRREIDAIDDEIVDLIVRRAERAIRIGRAKRRGGIPVRDREREAKVLARLSERAASKLEGCDVKRVFEKIMELMRRLEESDARAHGTRERSQKNGSSRP